MMRLIRLCLFLSFLPACQAPSSGDPPTLFVNGRIWTDARAAEPVEALLVQDGRVQASGSSVKLAQLLDGPTRRIDLQGRIVVPGLQDAHGHIENLGELLETLDLTSCQSFEELVELVGGKVRALPPGEWIVGRGWDQTRWPGAEFPVHAELSAVSPDHPVYLRRVDGHAALANEFAMRLAGLERGSVPEVEGGVVHVDGDGAPTGVLIDAAMGLVAAHRPEPDTATRRRRFLAAQEALLEAGLVAVHDMGLGEDSIETLLALEAEGLWKLRVIGYVWANEGLSEALASYPRKRDLDPTRKVRILGAKLMLDGALGSRGAALFEDYSDAPGVRGHLLAEESVFRERLGDVVDAGLQPAVHAIGDRANGVLLDAYADRMASDPDFARLRPRVEHAQVVALEDLERFGQLGIVRSIQPTHATSDMRWAEERLGSERVKGSYAWRRLAKDPGTLAFGSDFPVERHQPLEGLYAAVTRQDREGAPDGGWYADQRLTPAEALAAFTSGAAFAVGEEDARGTLAVGAFADFTVLDVDPLRDPPANWLAGRAWMTVVDGAVVYERRPAE